MDKALNHNNDQVGGTHFPDLTRDHPSPLTINPLTEPLPIWYEFYKRLKLSPWWMRMETNAYLIHRKNCYAAVIMSSPRFDYDIILTEPCPVCNGITLFFLTSSTEEYSFHCFKVNTHLIKLLIHTPIECSVQFQTTLLWLGQQFLLQLLPSLL